MSLNNLSPRVGARLHIV